MAISVPVPKRPEWNQDKSSIEPYQKADYLFFGSCPCGCSLIFPHKRGIRHTGGGDYHGGCNAIFFLAMYEKDGFPAEKILYFMLRQKVLTPGIRPYKSENLYEQLEEREKIRKEVCFLEEKAKGGSGKAKAERIGRHRKRQDLTFRKRETSVRA